MFLQIFLCSVILLVIALIGAGTVFLSIWKNFNDEKEVFKRVPWMILFGILNALGFIGAIASVTLKYFGYLQ